MKDCIKSKFTKDAVYWTMLPFGFFIALLAWGNVDTIKKMLLNDISIWGIVIILSIDGLVIFAINVLKIRYYIISKEQLKYYSFWLPFGKTLYFSDYIGKIITSETGSEGSYKVVYLVDRKNRTRLKIMGLHYKNFEEINDAIPLKKISFSPSVGSYFKLLFTGKINVEKENKRTGKRKNKNTERTIRKIIYIVVSIGLLCFVLGMIVKILSKLL